VVWFGDVSYRWARRGQRVVIVCLASLSIACTDTGETIDPTSEAVKHLAAGSPEAALADLRDAMRAAPDDPALRLLTARTYLQSGRGDLAEVALDQALERGADPHAALPLRARALLVQNRFAALGALTIPDGAPEAVDFEIQYLKVKALSSLNKSREPTAALTRAYLDVFSRLDALPRSPAVERVADELEEQRTADAAAARAWQHQQCSRSDVQERQWEPQPVSGRRILRVGTSRELKTPAEAAAAAEDGDLVEIDPGTYQGADAVARWTQNDIVVRGASERPHLRAAGAAVADRDVWLFTGHDVVVENVEISGARSPYGNGAGIRHIGRNLTLRHVRLADNENGVLIGNEHPDSSIVIEFSELARNGDDIGQAHNIYVGRSGSLILRYSYSHGTRPGHLVKSRARENLIAYNRIADSNDGGSSYLIDLPEGGSATIIGNELQQGTETNNHIMVSFAAENLRHENNSLTLASNTIYNRDFRGIVLRNHSDAEALLVNNLVGGAPVVLAEGPHVKRGNLTLADHGLNDPRNLDFTLRPGAAAIDAAVAGPEPEFEYLHPARYRSRPVIWRPDVGAHERCGI